MSVYVCLSVCVHLYTIISRDLRVRPSPIFACYIMPVVRSSSGCVAIRYVFGFMDDVKFAHNAPYGGLSIYRCRE